MLEIRKKGIIYGIHFTISDNDEVHDMYNGFDFIIYDILVNFLNMELDTYEKLNNDIKLLPKDIISLSKTDYLKFRLYDLIDEYLNVFLDDYMSEATSEELEELLSSDDSYDYDDPRIYRPFIFKKLQRFQSDFKDNLLIAKNSFFCDVIVSLNYANGIVTENYQINDIVTFIIFSIKRLNAANKIIKKCENCGDYFIPSTKNEKYCDKIYPNGRTCKLMGYENKIKREDNQIMYEYRKAYKNHNSIMNRTKHTGPKAEEHWDLWKITAKEKLKECQEGLITLDDFKEWLTNS